MTRNVLEEVADWSIARPMPWRLLAVFGVAGCFGFVAFLVLGIILLSWWMPVTAVFIAALGCGLGTGIGSAAISLCFDF